MPFNFKKIFLRPRNKGLSLIELLVVVAIIGVLAAAVSTPAYNGYRRNAAQNTLVASMNNIRKGFQACVTLKAFSDCNTLGKVNVVCNGCPSGGISPNFCASAENNVGGDTFQACVTTNGSSGATTVINNWEPIPCATAQGTCNAGSLPTIGGAGGCPTGCGQPATCTTNDAFTCTTGSFSSMTVSCNTTAGTCGP